jgi:adenylyltransferase/sulfurtransferase
MIVHAHRNESVVDEVLRSKDNFKELDYSAMSESEDEFTPDTISASEALGLEGVQWVDVRELHEHPRLISIVSEEIPLSQFDDKLDRLDREQTVIVFCQSGVRSLKACQILHRSGFKKIKSVEGGAEALSLELLVDYEY